MGLDCTAYSHLRYREDLSEISEHTDLDGFWDNCDELGLIVAWAYKDFTSSTRGLTNHDVVTHCVMGTAGEIAWGVYEKTRETEDYGFRAGSYSGYGEWRNNLSKAILGVSSKTVWEEPEKYATAPFYELIHFADNEGCIGPEAAADLYADFVTYRDEFVRKTKSNPEGEWYLHKYDVWTKACLIAAQDGLIDFH